MTQYLPACRRAVLKAIQNGGGTVVVRYSPENRVCPAFTTFRVLQKDEPVPKDWRVFYIIPESWLT